MPYTIRSAVNVRQPTVQQLRSRFWSFEPSVTGVPLRPGATLVLEDEAYNTNVAIITAMAADALITVEGVNAPVTVVEPPAVSREDPNPSPAELTAAVEKDNKQRVTDEVVQPLPPAELAEPQTGIDAQGEAEQAKVERHGSKKSGKRG